MPDETNENPLFPADKNPPSPQDANSNNPPPAGGGDGPSAPGAPTGPGALSMLSINIEEEMRRSYLDYSMSVIIGRALPDVRDGLKPVHRRILYGMQEMGLQFNKKYTKSAKVVGHVMGNYHPHGDSAIYDTMVRLAQPFSLRYPLIDGQGNFGSVDGDPPAAMRYTESRLTRIASEMLADIDNDTVDFVPNYDESTSEPSVLPARIPNLIINGGTGIAVGMATNIPPHNLTETLNATIALLQKEKSETRSDLEMVLEHVKGPDFPTGGFIYGRSNIAQTYKTGRGRFMMRAKCFTENITGGRQAIIVTEIPYQVNKSNLIKRIAELVNDKVIDDISDVRDESDRDGMRIVIELKRGAQQEIVLNQLYKNTSMQESFSMIFLAVHNGQPKELPLPDAIWAFIDHRIDVVRRRTAFLLNKAREREHVLLGYQIALDHLDTVIKIIRQSASRVAARENLFNYFSNRRINLNGTELAGVTLDPAKYAIDLAGGSVSAQLANNSAGTLILSYRQIDAILELQLYRLTQLSIDELLNELRTIRENIAEYESILASEKKLRRVIIKELEDIRDKYGDARRTTILDESTELTLEDLIADEQVAVTVSNTGYLKRTPISSASLTPAASTGSRSTRSPTSAPPARAKRWPHSSTSSPAKKSSPSSPSATSTKTASTSSSPPATAPSKRPRSRTSPTSWPAASSPSASTRTTSSSPPRSPTASKSSSSPPTKAWPSASPSRTSAPWVARLSATAASTSRRATTSSAPLSRPPTKPATSSASPAPPPPASPPR
jgi:DNA gyrase subunit A